MTDQELTAARRRVESMSTALKELSDKTEKLHERRRLFFAELVGKGVPQAELARWAGVSQQAVAATLGKIKETK